MTNMRHFLSEMGGDFAFREYLPSPEVITGSVANILDVLVK